MIGVVFALLTGYSAVYTNVAFGLWTVLGGCSGNSVPNFRVNSVWTFLKKLMSIVTFNRLYLGLLAYTAFTGFASPLTFLVIAFAGERASVWTEKLLAKILPKSAAAPSTAAVPVADPNKLNDAPPKWPAFHYWAKSMLMLGTMAAAGVLLSVTVFGVTSLLTNLGIASVLAFVPFFFAKKIIKLLMKAQPTTKEQDPEFFEIMEGLRDRINADRRAKGKKEIPVPGMVIDPMDAPNAYATGRRPFAAMVGVTKGIKAMTPSPRSSATAWCASSRPPTPVRRNSRCSGARSGGRLRAFLLMRHPPRSRPPCSRPSAPSSRPSACACFAACCHMSSPMSWIVICCRARSAAPSLPASRSRPTA